MGAGRAGQSAFTNRLGKLVRMGGVCALGDVRVDGMSCPRASLNRNTVKLQEWTILRSTYNLVKMQVVNPNFVNPFCACFGISVA